MIFKVISVLAVIVGINYLVVMASDAIKIYKERFIDIDDEEEEP